MRYFIALLLVFFSCFSAFSQEIKKPLIIPEKPETLMNADTSKPRSVSLDKKSIYLLVGGTSVKLEATVSPAEALNRNVRWESSNSKVVTVDSTGKVSPVGMGTCRVLVYTEEGGYSAACDVMVDLMNTVGNTPGNSLNGGYLARQGNWVYYANPYDGMKLYKSRLLGPKERIKLSNDRVSCINVIGEWVYYINHSQSNKLFKIRIDGTGEKRICDVDELYRPATSGFENVYVIDDRIYYISSSYLRSITVNGMDRKKLTDENNIKFFVPCGEWYYYSKLVDDGLYRIRKDGTGKTKVWDAPLGSFSVDGDFVYLTNEENAIIRIAPDRGRLFYAKNINASNSWIYWSNLASDIMKMRNDFKLSDTLVSFEGKDRKDIKIFVTDDWIFYYTFSRWGVPDGLFMVRTDAVDHHEFK